MELVLFKTNTPFDHVQRALDTLRSMGFVLEALSVGKADADNYLVELRFRPQGSLSAQTFVNRLARRNGLEICDQHAAAFRSPDGREPAGLPYAACN